jgi:hypothetical protein
MTQWDLAGLTHEEWGLERPLEMGWFRVAGLKVAGGRLLWRWPDPRKPNEYIRVRPAPGMLQAFLDLADASPDAILSYALRWGVLVICDKHGLPASHVPRKLFSRDALERPQCQPLAYENYQFWAPLEAWRHFSRKMRAILDIAARLYRGGTAAREQWAIVYEWSKVPFPETPPPWATSHDLLVGERALLGSVVAELLELGGVQPSFFWVDESPRLTFASGDLFGALALELALAVGRTDSLAACSGCGMTYMPGKRRRGGRRNYCESCQKRGVPVRDAARDYRARLRSARKVAGRSRKPKTQKRRGSGRR